MYKWLIVIALATSCQPAPKSELGSGPVPAVVSTQGVTLQPGPEPHQLKILVGKEFPKTANAVTLHLDSKSPLGRLFIRDAQTQEPVMQADMQDQGLDVTLQVKPGEEHLLAIHTSQSTTGQLSATIGSKPAVDLIPAP